MAVFGNGVTVVSVPTVSTIVREGAMTSNTLTAPVADGRRPLELDACIGKRRASYPQVAAGRRRGISLLASRHWGLRPRPFLCIGFSSITCSFVLTRFFRPRVESVEPVSEPARDQVLWISAMDRGGVAAARPAVADRRTLDSTVLGVTISS